jgi:hypothetical protein
MRSPPPVRGLEVERRGPVTLARVLAGDLTDEAAGAGVADQPIPTSV